MKFRNLALLVAVLMLGLLVGGPWSGSASAGELGGCAYSKNIRLQVANTSDDALPMAVVEQPEPIVVAQSGYANPCAAKGKMNPCNPCAAKAKMNPCNPGTAKMNPCNAGTAKMNPCAAKAKMNPCNPRAAKKNPCNPCAAK